MSGSLSGSATNYVTQTSYWPNNSPWYFVRGNNLWHVNAINVRMQTPESYEAVNNSNGSISPSSILFVSCPNWGLNPNNYGTYDICPHSSATNNNGLLQGYSEYLGKPGASAFQNFSQTITNDSLNRLTSVTDSTSSTINWSRNFSYDQWGNMWVSGNSGIPLASSTTPTTNVYNPSNNQDTRWTYDSAGNRNI